MHLNHPEIIHPPPQVCGKIIFHGTSPWCQKGWCLLSYRGWILMEEGICFSLSWLALSPLYHPYLSLVHGSLLHNCVLSPRPV